MDKTDKKILETIQSGFPVTQKPYQELSKQIEIPPEEILERIKKLTKKGYIRRIAPIIDSRKIGLTGTLVAMKVPEQRIEEVAETINQYTEVSHNYERNHEYNLWFTLSSPTRQRNKEIINEIKNKTNIQEVIELPSIKMFKIGVSFSFTDS